MKKSWKTSAAGIGAILVALGSALSATFDADPVTVPDWGALVAAIIAHAQVHRIAWWKVAISLVVIPCLCVCGIYAMLFAAVAKSFAG